jgi:hypothetical protein
MLPLMGCCSEPASGADSRRRYQERKLSLLRFWRDGVERQLAALEASISTLERQMERDRVLQQD